VKTAKSRKLATRKLTRKDSKNLTNSQKSQKLLQTQLMVPIILSKGFKVFKLGDFKVFGGENKYKVFRF